MNTIEKGLCQCGCGNKSPIASATQTSKGWTKGEPKRFISGHNKKRHQNFDLSSKGKFRSRYGYIYSKCPNHPRAGRLGYVLEHILVAEQSLGRLLVGDEVVHHKNGKRDDNRPENLEVLESTSAHQKLHWTEKALRECGNAHWRKCQFCHNYDDPAVMIRNGPTSSGVCHKECRDIYWRKYRAMKRN